MSRTRKLAEKVIYVAMQVLAEKGGEAAVRDLLMEVEKRAELDDWAKGIYEKSGYVRWRSVLAFFSIDLIKAGYIVKKNRVWYITSEGRTAIQLGEQGLLDAATAAYRKWRFSNPSKPISEESASEGDEVEQGEGEQAQEATLQETEQLAFDGIRKRIDSLNAYEMQDLVAALLRGMKYYTPFVAPRGKDGGIDVLAYQDPLGVRSPRIKVQVKHKTAAASVQEVRELIGLLGKDGDTGMFVSTAGFTADAKTTARNAHVHVELVDLERLIALWLQFYPALADEDKELLRLRPVYFYDPAI